MTTRRTNGGGATSVDIERDELLEFLRTRRWFGDKGRTIRSVTVRDSIHIEWPNSHKPFSVLRVDVETDAGRSTYQVFVERGTGRINDALEDPEFRRGLVDAFVADLTFEGRGVRWRFQSEGKVKLVAPPAAVIRLSETEQSNSSVIIDRQAILKLFRKLEPGIHPDVEVTRFLTIERQFVHVPVILGTIVFEDDEGTTVAGMLQELVPGAVDAWTYALTTSRAWFGGRGDITTSPFEADAEQLGIITRALHETLASGDPGSAFELRPAGDADVRAWTRRTVQMIERATESLERALAAKSVPPGVVGVATEIVQGREDHVRRVSEIAEQLGEDRGALTRTHGDYHLGQVIRSDVGQFLVIDFEGEPARPLQERRAHQSPLRDVAGMLRSFAYAAAVGSAEAGEGAADRARVWQQRARDAFLRAYLRTPRDAYDVLPSSPGNAARLLALFETEKAFYELQYELDHRPEWVWIPLSGIASFATT